MSGFISKLFGGSNKGIVEQAADVVERFAPGEVKRHQMGIEDLKAGDDSQASARAMMLAHHESRIDIVVDAINRLIRPVITIWVMGLLFGWWQAPIEQWARFPEMVWNIIWTVITFWFGARVIFKDIPSAVRIFKK